MATHKLNLTDPLLKSIGEAHSIMAQPLTAGRRYLFIRDENQIGVPGGQVKGKIVWNFNGESGDARQDYYKTAHAVQLTGGSVNNALVPLTALVALTFAEQAQGKAAIKSLASAEVGNQITLEMAAAYQHDDRSGVAITEDMQRHVRLSLPNGGGLIAAAAPPQKGDAQAGPSTKHLAGPGIMPSFNKLMGLFDDKTVGSDMMIHVKENFMNHDATNAAAGLEVARRLENQMKRLTGCRAMQLLPGVMPLAMQGCMLIDRIQPEKKVRR